MGRRNSTTVSTSVNTVEKGQGASVYSDNTRNETEVNTSYEVRPDVVVTSDLEIIEKEDGRIIFDDTDNRNKYWDGEKWISILAEDDIQDSVKEDIANILREFCVDKETEIHIVTAREEKWRQDTEEWLKINDIPFNKLYMRGLGDSRSDSDVKRDIYTNNFIDKKVWFVLEDRDKVVKMWRELGLSCMQVAEGDY